MDKHESTHEYLLQLLAEIVIDQSLRSHRKTVLYLSIDEALAKGNKEAFLALTAELNQLLEDDKVASMV